MPTHNNARTKRLETEVADLYQIVGFLTDCLHITDENRSAPLDNALNALQAGAGGGGGGARDRRQLLPYPIAPNDVINALLTLARYRQEKENAPAAQQAAIDLIARLAGVQAESITVSFAVGGEMIDGGSS